MMAGFSRAAPLASPWRLCVAPMMDWTDRHCRYFHRLLSPHARLYSEMLTAAAVVHGDRKRLLDFDPVEHPVALQLGGNDPGQLADAAAFGAAAGYDEINLNVGCPSARVASGAFGACLMYEPERVAAAVAAMSAAADVPVTVKTRIGVDQREDYGFLRDFVAAAADAGCSTFIVHARRAILTGLSPRENRSIPPLRPEVVYRLKGDFPELCIVINGGIDTLDAVDAHLAQGVDGVMIGRKAYHEPYWLTAAERHLFAPSVASPSREVVVRHMQGYAARFAGHAHHRLAHVTRHMLGLYHGVRGGRAWRRFLGEGARVPGADAALIGRSLSVFTTEHDEMPRSTGETHG